MSKKLKVVFFGTPDFAVHILNEIISSPHEVVGVVTVPDKSAGRGRKIHSSAVAQYAKQKDLLLLQPHKLKSEEFLKALKNLEADVFVIVAFRKLPKVVWEMPPHGTFNLHASLLPDYRGAAPINWAIINGEKQSGVTTFFIDENIDTGEIILQKSCDISPDQTAGELHDKLMVLGGEATIETLNLIAQDQIIAQVQKENSNLKDAPKLFRDNTKINWQAELNEIYNFVRGLNPYPTAWTYFKNDNEKKYVKIFSVKIESKQHDYKLGSIFSEHNQVGVAHQEGIIWIESLQMEGKKRLRAQDFLNGFPDIAQWNVI